MPNFPELFLMGFAAFLAVPAIKAIVNLIKKIAGKYNVDLGAWNALIAVALGIGTQLWIIWTFEMMSKLVVSSAIGVGILVGLAAAGLYDTSTGK